MRSRPLVLSLVVVSAVSFGACSSTAPAPGLAPADDGGSGGATKDGSGGSSSEGGAEVDGAAGGDAAGGDASGGDASGSDATTPDGASATDGGADAATSDANAEAGSDGGADAAVEASVDAGADAADAGPKLDACGAGKFQLGEYGTYLGKVNVHRDTGGTWSVDSDCSSGGNNNTVAYCQKFWPAATTQVSVAVVGNKPYTAGGGTAPTCGGVYNEPGQAQYACCAPNPCGDGAVPVGTYATWSGKVNVHRSATGAWSVDSDCSSGANVNTVAYCQKYWPTATSQIAVTPEAGNKPFTAGGGTAPTCGGVYLGVGQNQYVCCAPR